MDLNWCKMGADIMRSSTYGEFIVNKLRVIIACQGLTRSTSYGLPTMA